MFIVMQRLVNEDYGLDFVVFMVDWRMVVFVAMSLVQHYAL